MFLRHSVLIFEKLKGWPCTPTTMLFDFCQIIWLYPSAMEISNLSLTTDCILKLQTTGKIASSLKKATLNSNLKKYNLPKNQLRQLQTPQFHRWFEHSLDYPATKTDAHQGCQKIKWIFLKLVLAWTVPMWNHTHVVGIITKCPGYCICDTMKYKVDHNLFIN